MSAYIMHRMEWIASSPPTPKIIALRMCFVSASTVPISSCGDRLRGQSVPSFNGLDAVYECLFQNALSDRPEHEAKQATFEVLACTDDLHVNIGRAVGMTGEGIAVSGRAFESSADGPHEIPHAAVRSAFDLFDSHRSRMVASAMGAFRAARRDAGSYEGSAHHVVQRSTYAASDCGVSTQGLPRGSALGRW